MSNLLRVGLTLIISKLLNTILWSTLPVGTGSTLEIFKISKLSFQLSFQIYSLLTQIEGKRKAFLEGCKKEYHIARLSLGRHKT